MMMLFDEEYILKTYIESEIQEAAEKAEKIGEKRPKKGLRKKRLKKQ